MIYLFGISLLVFLHAKSFNVGCSVGFSSSLHCRCFFFLRLLYLRFLFGSVHPSNSGAVYLTYQHDCVLLLFVSGWLRIFYTVLCSIVFGIFFPASMKCRFSWLIFIGLNLYCAAVFYFCLYCGDVFVRILGTTFHRFCGMVT